MFNILEWFKNAGISDLQSIEETPIASKMAVRCTLTDRAKRVVRRVLVTSLARLEGRALGDFCWCARLGFAWRRRATPLLITETRFILNRVATVTHDAPGAKRYLIRSL
jgi:hypothetical protein